MDFEWTEEQQLLRDSVRRFLEERAGMDFVRSHWDDPIACPDDLWSAWAGLGVTGLLIPEEYGGGGLGVVDMGVVLEELGRALHPTPILSCALIAARLLERVGTEAERETWLPRLAEGRVRIAVALGDGEPQLEARLEGAQWLLTGELAPVLDAAACDLWLVPARIDGTDESVRVFLVERDGAGVMQQPFESVDGSRKLARLEFDAAAATRLGRQDACDAIREARDLLAIGLVADAVGAADRALELATAYAMEREQFGRPIGSFQSLQHLLVDMLQSIECVRAAALYALWSADQSNPDERAHAIAIAKAAAAEALPGVGASAIQVFGGIGFTWEMDIHMYDKRLCSQALLGGQAHHFLERIAQAAIDESSART